MAKTFKVTIDRFQNEKTPTSYVQTYELAHYPSQTLLEVLAEIQNRLDDTLAFRSSCEAGKCGSCAVQMNGKPALACRTMVDGNDIQIGPLPSFPVVRDLIVDREREMVMAMYSSRALPTDETGRIEAMAIFDRMREAIG